MAVNIIVKGDKELISIIKHIRYNIKDKSDITFELAKGMKEVVHVDTGYLKSTIYSNKNKAGAKAPYAGYEEERGNSHAFATRAIENFDIRKYANKLLGKW